ncbi:MAG: NADH-quinone oxidoreductase subunit C [Thermoproteota archaeon]|nr:NADH-quinone oxidoreductase subunit C [Thermoproteota archaeon]MDQ3983873.1 NADH-quinone oxidoreductase subunit C [Thermoproteota archaeon]MDQ4022119.1 NADH-quinone oxidoreductase subunit C [Thermoproteota archaeon]
MSEDSKKSKSSDTTTSTSQSSPSSKPAADSPHTNIAPSTPTTKASPSPPPSSKPAATTAVAKKEPEPPPFEKGLMTQLSTRFGDKVKASYIRPLRIKIYVDPANIVEVASFLRDSMGFDHAESVAGIDYPKDNQIEVAYHLGSYSRMDLGAHILLLATRTNRDDARLPTLINIYKSVEYHERETFEMLGVYFEGHPRNERFLLPEDWADIPPLRRDFRIKGR